MWTNRPLAQMLFLDIAGSLADSPLKALHRDILPKYQTAFKFERENEQSDAEIARLACFAIADVVYMAELAVSLPEVREAQRAHPLLYEASAALSDWCETFNLLSKPSVSHERQVSEARFERDHWPAATALKTILCWQFHPLGWFWGHPSRLSWCPPILTFRQLITTPSVLPTIQLRVNVQVPGSNDVREMDVPDWCIGWETEAQFQQRIKELFDIWLENHLATRRKLAPDVEATKLHNKSKLALHLKWAAKYQVGKVSRERLAKEYRVAQDTIEEGIQTSLDLIHLARRPPSRGGLKRSRQ